MPSGVQAIALERRYIRPRAAGTQPNIFEGIEELAWQSGADESLLLDPQLYLAGLSAHTCGQKCANLVGYPWFDRHDVAPYDSGKITQNEYRDQVRGKIDELWKGLPNRDEDIATAVDEAIHYQLSVGCSEIVLPSPLTIDPGSDYSTEVHWLDLGLKRARALAPDLRALATVAVSDICTFSADPDSNRLLETILDHVTAREPQGVYIVIEQRIDPGYYISSLHTLRTLLRLVGEMQGAGVERIVVSWVGLAGYLSLAAGAHGWASGWYRSERRLKLDDFRDDSGGRAAPAFYSHRLCGEVHTDDLDRIRDADLLSLIEEDTPWANDLFRALRAGKKAKTVEQWTNHAARSHFNSVVIRETDSLLRLPLPSRVEYVKNWLRTAADIADKISKADIQHDRTTVDHQATWRKAFDLWATPTNDDSNRTHSGE